MSQMYRKIVFIHSPIQYFIAQELLSHASLGADCLFVFHRGQKPLASFTPESIISDNYLLNDNAFISGLLHANPEVAELILPHSLCLAFEIALGSHQIKRVSYLEEGTGTLYALHDPQYSQAISKSALSWSDKIRTIFRVVRHHGFGCLGQTVANIRLEERFRARARGLFLDNTHDKAGIIYGLGTWSLESPHYQSVKLASTPPVATANKVLFAIGKAEMKIPGYWPLIDHISTELARHGIVSVIKLHPSIKRKSFKGESSHRNAFLARAVELPAQDDELGFVIVKQGFLGAVSFFSSFQVYAHILSQSMGIHFPMLSLERLLGQDDFAQKAAMLPNCNLLENIDFDVEAWLAHALTRAPQLTQKA